MDITTVTEVVRQPPARPGSLWRDGDAWLAGGTWLFSDRQPEVRRLIDLVPLGWDSLVADGAGLEIGAMCTIRDLYALTAPADWTAASLLPISCEAFLASFKVWNSATVGGNICMALPAGPMITMTVALAVQDLSVARRAGRLLPRRVCPPARARRAARRTRGAHRARGRPLAPRDLHGRDAGARRRGRGRLRAPAVRARLGRPRASAARSCTPRATARRRRSRGRTCWSWPGCSGAEIAFDLAEGGAARVRLAVRTAPNIIVRDPVGALRRRSSTSCRRGSATP